MLPISTSSTRNTQLTIAGLGVLLIIATTIAYWTVFSCGYISIDDGIYVYENPQVLSGLSWSGFRYAWTTFDCTNWHPLTWLSLELDGSFWGKNPVGYHATNLALHLANSLLVMIVWHRLTKNVTLSAAVSGLFALHPLHVESVAWIAERKDVLCTFFLLLTILGYAHYAARPSVTRYLLVTVLFALGLTAKPMLVTLPLLLCFLDHWPLDRIVWHRQPQPNSVSPRQSPRWLILEKIPLLAMAFFDGIMTIVAQFGVVKHMTDITWDMRIANMFNALLWYLQKTFVPTQLAFFYPHPEANVSWVSAGVGLLLCGVISYWSIRQRRVRPYLLFGWAWFVISLLPVIGLIQVGAQAYADRYAYIPHLGLFTAIVWEIHSRLSGLATGKSLAGILLVAALLACGILTHQQTGYWRNNDTLWSRALELNPDNGPAHAYFAEARFAAGDYEQALLHTENVLRIRRSGHRDHAYAMWGRCLVALDRSSEAEEKFRAALEITPNHPAALNELSKLLYQQGRTEEAARLSAQLAATQADKIAQHSDTAAAQMLLGQAEVQKRNLPQALVHFQKAVTLAPDSAEAVSNLALIQMQLKQFPDAKRNFNQALKLKPELTVAHLCLAMIYEQEHDIPAAKAHLSEALRLNPNDERIKRRWDKLSQQ